MKQLKNLFKLSSKISIYVPATVNVNEHIDNSEYVNRTATLLSGFFGGATSSKALGYWLTTEGHTVKEKTTLVFSYCSDIDLEKHIESIVNYCESIKKEMSQEAIALEINGELYFV